VFTLHLLALTFRILSPAQMPRHRSDPHTLALREAHRLAQRQAEKFAGRAQRINRIQSIHYPTILERLPIETLPVPPLVIWGGRSEWDRDYRVWRDSVIALADYCRAD
jgi:hypothetical protein